MNLEPLRKQADELELQTDLWWLAMMLFGFMASFLAAFTSGGVFWAYLSGFVRLAIAIGLTQQPWGGVFTKLLGFAVAAGAFSIFPDFLLVHWDKGGQRLYPEQALVLSSPLYVPVLWACAVVEFGYAIVRLYGLAAKKLPGEAALGAAMLAGGFIAGIWTACTDFWAVKARWWTYAEGRVILGGGFAFYVVMAVFVLFVFFLPLYGRYLACAGTRLYAAVRYGLLFSGVGFLTFMVSHWLVEQGF
jgi:hypothetical protein